MTEYLASPTRIAETDSFTAETLGKVASYLAGATGPVLIVVDPRPFPLRDEALAAFARTRSVLVLDRVVPNPTVGDIQPMAEDARAFAPVAVIGIGGGSTLDSAKAVALLLANAGDLDEYLGPQASRKAEVKGPPLILIPTTTGTGSEVTKFGVYTSRSGRKYTLNSPFLQADAALLCPALTADLPAPLVAATGYDALTHALEALWNRNANPVSDALGLHAATAVLKAIEPAWREASTDAAALAGSSGAARAVLLRAATAAGVAFNRTGTAAIHALSFIVSEEWHLSHGAACALFTEEIFDTNLADPAVRSKLVLLARQALDLDELAFQDDAAALSALRDRLVALKQLMGLPCSFGDIPGFSSPEDAPATDALCARFDPSQNDPKLKNNMVALDIASVRELVRGKLR